MMTLTEKRGGQALIVAGGQTDAGQLREEIQKLRQAGGILIAADRGLEVLLRLLQSMKTDTEAEADTEKAVSSLEAGFLPDIAVGDFDSVSPETLAVFQRYGAIRWERHRPEKDESDTELAFTIAEEAGVSRILLMGVTGTRIDHMLSNVHLLKRGMNSGIECFLLDAHNRVRLVSEGCTFWKAGNPYPFVSFLPLTMEVTHVKLTGFKYPLADYHMVLGVECARCVSNEIAAGADEAHLEFDEGLLLVIESRD